MELPHIIKFPKICDPRGNLTFVQDNCQVPFDIRRVYWVYDVPGDSLRGSHSHRATVECIIAVSGCFDVTLHDGTNEQTFTLRLPNEGLLVPPGYWRTLQNFSSGAVCMVLASLPYDEDDYIRDFDTFMKR